MKQAEIVDFPFIKSIAEDKKSTKWRSVSSDLRPAILNVRSNPKSIDWLLVMY